MSNASLKTRKPIESARSISCGSGILWLVRMALTPIPRRIRSFLSMAQTEKAAPRQPRS